MLFLVVLFTFLTVTFSVLAVHQYLVRDQERAHTRVGQAIALAQQRFRRGDGGSGAADARAGATQGDAESILDQRAKMLLRWASRLVEAASVSKAVEKEMQRAGVALRGSEFVIMSLLAGLIASFLGFFLGGALVSLLFFGLGLVLPRSWLKLKAAKRLAAFNAQIVDALTMMSGSLKAGYSFMQAMELVAREMPAPMSEEFRRSLREMGFGMASDESLASMAERVGSDDLDLVITAVLIQRQVGGNLAEVLDKIAFTVRERIRIKGEIKTLTAQGRISGLIVSLLPIGIGGMIALINPGYMAPLFQTPVGQMMLGIGIISQVIGMFVIRKIVNIEV